MIEGARVFRLPGVRVEGDGHLSRPNIEVVPGGSSAELADPSTTQSALTYTSYRAKNAVLLAVGDGLAFLTALGIVAMLGLSDEVIGVGYWTAALASSWLAGASILRLIPGWGLGPVEELRRTVLLLTALFGASTGLLFAAGLGHVGSAAAIGAGYLLCVVLVPLVRLKIKRFLVARGSWGVPVVLYGSGEVAARIIKLLHSERGLGYDPVAVLSEHPGEWGTMVDGVPVLDAALGVQEEAPVAIIALSALQRTKLPELLEGPASFYKRVILVPDLSDIPSLWIQPRDLSGMLGLEVAQNLVGPVASTAKRWFDVLAVLASVPLWGSLCAAVALLVWLEDRGHPFFIQVRQGRNGRRFRTWKFRTMVPDADRVLENRLKRDPELRSEWEANWKLKDDPRITRVGRFLRRTSLDELPQLINVLRGEMSLVGPRPLPDYHVFDLPDQVRRMRTRVRPGLTGLWQVSGRSDAGNGGLERWDAYYIRNWSLWLDIVIMVRTVRAVLRQEGAY